MKPYKTLIVENDKNNLEELLYHLKSYEPVINPVKCVGKCSQAIDALTNESFLVSIIDIELDDGNCFDIFNVIPRNRFGAVIFFSDYGNRYYQELFRFDPIGYLAKPLVKQQLQEHVIKVDEFYLQQIRKAKLSLFHPENGNKIIVALDDILYIELINKRSYYHFRIFDTVFYSVGLDPHPLSSQINKLDNRFIQCSRQFIINTDFLGEYKPDGNDFLAIMPNRKEIPISRGFKEAVSLRTGIRW